MSSEEQSESLLHKDEAPNQSTPGHESQDESVQNGKGNDASQKKTDDRDRGTDEQRGTESKEPIDEPKKVKKLEKVAQTNRQVTSTGKKVLSLLWLPLVSDKVRNNVKNRWTLLAAYANATALVLLVLVILFTNNEVSPDKVGWSVPPAQYFELGVPIPPFSVRLVDGLNNPIPGRKFYFSMSLISPYTRTVRLTDSETASSRPLSCLNTMLYTADPFRDEDMSFCMPQASEYFLANRSAVTDQDGTATFDNAVLGIGAAGASYLMIITPEDDDPNLMIYTYAQALGSVYSIKQLTVINQPGGRLAYRTPYTFDIEAIVGTSGATPRMATAQVMVANMQTQFGLRGLGYSKAIPSGRRYSSLDVASFNYTNVGVGIYFANMTEDNKVWRMVIRFKDVTLFGSNHRQMYFTLALWGTSIPLLTLPTVSEYMFPQKVYLTPSLLWSAGPPLNAPTALHFPTARQLIMYKKSDPTKTPLKMFDKVREGEELILSIKITSPSGSNQLPYFVLVEPSHNLTTVSTNFDVDGSPFYRPKEINSKTVAIQHTSSFGEGEWEWFFSFTGNIGLYDVTVAVDGGDLPWSSVPEYSQLGGTNYADTRLPLTLDVQSSIKHYTIGENKAPWVQPPNVVRVGEAWQKVPFIIVSREAMENGVSTNVSVPGKRMRINPRNSSDVIGIHVESQAGDQNGIINPVSIKVLYATEEGNYTFDLYVDDLLVGSITKFVKFPDVAPDYCVPSYGKAPPVGWAGVLVQIDLFARDYQGKPLEGASMLFSIDTGVSYNDATFKGITDSNGMYTWINMATGLSAWMAAPFNLVCEKKKSASTFNPIADQIAQVTEPETAFMMVPIQPRYKGLRSANISADGSLVTLEIDLEWSQVNTSQPVHVGQTMNWQPRYIQNWWGSGEIRGMPPGYNYNPPIQYTGVKPITSQSEAVITLNGTGYQPGFYLLSISIDYTQFGITPQVNMPSLVTNLTLTRSIFGQGNTFEQNKPFAVPPQITLVSVMRENRHMVAQLGCRPLGSKNDVPFSWIWPQETDAYNGTAPQDHAIATTDSSGLATFSNLNVRSLRVGLEYTFRYCAAIDMIEANTTTQTIADVAQSYCVTEAQTFSLAEFVKPRQKVITVNPRKVTVTPGGPIPFLNVSITDTLGQQVEDGQFVFQAEVTEQQIASGAALNCYYFGTAERIYNKTQEGFVTPCVTSINTPPGQYAVYAVGEGVRSNAVLVTVTDKVENLDLRVGQFASDSNFSLGYTLPVSVKATSVTDDPSPFKAIELSISGIEGSDDKEPVYQLKSGSLVTGQTDKRGIAILPISFQSAPTGSFTITAKVQAAGSNAALQQAVSSGLSDVAFKFGAAPDTLHDFVNPAFFSVLQILNRLASAPLAQSTASGVLGSVSNNFEGVTLNSLLDGSSNIKQRVLASASDVYKGITEVKASPTQFKIQNPVHMLKVLEQNKEEWEVIATFGQVVTVSYTYTFGPSTLRLQALDAFGNPVSYQQIDYSTGTSNARIIIPQGRGSARVTDDKGMVNLEGLQVQVFASGDFKLTCSAQGGGEITIEDAFSFNVVTLPPATLMRYIAFILVGCYSPLLLASVPHSRVIYSVLSIGFTISVFVLTVWFAVTTYQVTNSTLLKWYLVYAALVCSFMCLCNIIGITLDFVSKSKPSLRWMNDEGRAVRIARYAQWITNVRIDKQMAERAEKEKNKEPETGIKAVIAKVSGAQESFRGGLAEKMEKLGLEELEDIVPGKKGKKRKQIERLPLEIPDDVDAAASVPMNYLIVVAITFVMAFALTLLMIFVLDKIKEGLAVLLSYLPNPQAQTNLGVANKLLIQTLSDGLPVFVRVFPQYSFLTNLIVPLQSIDIIEVLVTFRGFVEAFLLRLNIAFGIGIALGLIVVAITVIIILINIKKMTIEARRGKIGNGMSLVPSEGYIGLHCFHFIIAHQLVAWGVILVALLLSVGPLVKFLYDQLLLIAVASIVSVIVQFLLNKVLVGWYLTDGFTLLRPEGYAIWHFVGLILGIFTGLIKTVSRWGLGIGAFSGMFARLDVSIYPDPLLFLDKAHAGFKAVVVAEAKISNPIFLVFNALLLKELHLRTVARYPPHGKNAESEKSSVGNDEDTARPLTNDFREGNILAQIAVDEVHVATASSKQRESIFDPSCYSLSSVIVNLARVLARREASPGNSLDLWEEPVEPYLYLTTENYDPSRRARRERIANKFWLALLLHNNPSLRKYRKHNLYHEEENFVEKTKEEDESIPEIVAGVALDAIQ